MAVGSEIAYWSKRWQEALDRNDYGRAAKIEAILVKLLGQALGNHLP